MSKVEIINKNLVEKYGANKTDVEAYLRKKDSEQKEKEIQMLLDLLRENPNLTEEMVRPDLRKYFGIVKREYKKEVIKENSDNKLHLVIGEDIPANTPATFNSVALYLREKGNHLKLYADIKLPYLIDHVEFLSISEDNPRYILKEGYDPETESCQYICAIQPFGTMKGVYRLGLDHPIKICSIEPLCQQQSTENTHNLINDNKTKKKI